MRLTLTMAALGLPELSPTGSGYVLSSFASWSWDFDSRLSIWHLHLRAASLHAQHKMRPLTSVVTAALAGLAVAGKDPAEAYLFRSSSQPERFADASPRMPKEIARHIILQRVRLSMPYP